MRPRGEKARAASESTYLDWALAGFSGYLAVDELYDGPSCVLSAVDPRQQRRLLYEVLGHTPTRWDILTFLAGLNEQIRSRGHAVGGTTTDGSPLYPAPVRLALGDIPHQVCEFHVKRELTKAVLRVLARLRKRLAAEAPVLPRGRCPNTIRARRRHDKATAVARLVGELFEQRHLFVRRHLSADQRATLRRLTRGRPELRAMRAIVGEAYRLFDRRCRTETAVATLARLRRRVRRHPSLGRSLDKLNSE